MEGRIQDQEWFKKTVDELKAYRVLVKRIEIIEINLMKNAGPDAKYIANYGLTVGTGDNPDEISGLEIELIEKTKRVDSINVSFEFLDPREKEIIEAKFKQGKKDQEIYNDILHISSDTYYNGKPGYNTAIEKIAKCLGCLEC